MIRTICWWLLVGFIHQNLSIVYTGKVFFAKMSETVTVVWQRLYFPWLPCGYVCVVSIDIEGAKIDCLSFVYVPTTSAAHNRLLFFFLLRPFIVLMKKTHDAKQSIFLDVYG
jgi:hypothetical protein